MNTTKQQLRVVAGGVFCGAAFMLIALILAGAVTSVAAG